MTNEQGKSTISMSAALVRAAALSDCEDQFYEIGLQVIAEHLSIEAAFVVQPRDGTWQRIGETSTTIQPRFSLAADALDQEATCSESGWFAAPLISRASTTLGIDSQKVLLLNANQIELVLCEVAMLAEVVGLLAGLMGPDDSQQEVERLNNLLAMSQQWQGTSEMQPLLKSMAESATQLIDADRASIFLWDKPNGVLVGTPALGMEDGQLRIPDDAGIVGRVIRDGIVRRVDVDSQDAQQIYRAVDTSTGYTTKSLLCVPLMTPSGECLGALEVLNKRSSNFNDEDESQLRRIAAHAALALDRTQQWEELVNHHEHYVSQAAADVQIIGDCPQIEALRATVGRIAKTDLAVLLLGQNGTGKEVVARQIHFNSERRNHPFVAVNCAALTETLLESELFGHEKGAFTDAHDSRPGKFEIASHGTLFLDEIGDLSAAGQAKLLRVLEDKKVVRVGGSESIHTDVRIIAATNQDLHQQVQQGGFRQDLFYRLNVVLLELPPLAKRGDDVMLLAYHFLRLFCQAVGRKKPKITAAARKRLLAHTWPGNVRELRNLMERLAYLAAGDQIEDEDISFPTGATKSKIPQFEGSLSDATRQFQIHYVLQMLDRTRGNMTDAAQLLGLHRSNLYRKMRQLGITEPSEHEDQLADDN